MVIALILVISTAALLQFLLFYWRATISVTAAAPLSQGVRDAAGIHGEALGADDFQSIMHLHQICPDLKSNGSGVELVGCYYLLLEALARLSGSLRPWAVQEMATCSRYVAARIDQRIAHNRAFLAQVHAG